MSGQLGVRLSASKKSLLAASCAAAVTVPLMFGVLYAPAIQAQPEKVSGKFEV
jgi:hypothetical protein